MTPAGPSAPRRPDPPSPAAPAAADAPDLQGRCERLVAENAALRALVAGLLRRHEDERRVVARALHDGAGGSLTAIRMAAHAAMSEDDPDQRRADLEDVLAQAGDALDRIRGLCARLRPPPLDSVGLDAALRWHVETLAPEDRDRIALWIAPLPRRPAPEVEQACFRIAEEALANALRHSGAGTIALHVDVADNALVLEVRDDGAGCDVAAIAAARPGIGLATLRERARALGGRIELVSARDQGTRVLAVLPFA